MYVCNFLSVALHISATLILLGKILLTKSCSAISGKTRILYATVFTFRYVELILNSDGFYRIDKLLPIVSFVLAYIICYLIYYTKYQETYERDHDSVRIQYLLMIVLFIILCVNYDSRVSMAMVAFSNYLETVAVFPQFFMIIRAGKIQKSILCYLILLAFSSVFFTVFCVLYAPPWEYDYQYVFAISVVFYCIFFGYVWKSNIKICAEETQVTNDHKPNNIMHSSGADIDSNKLANNFYMSNLKECVLSLDINELKKYEDEKSNNMVRQSFNSKEEVAEAKSGGTNDHKPNNNMHSSGADTDSNELEKNVYKSNLKESVLSLETNELKKYEDEKSNNLVRKTFISKEEVVEAKSGIWPVGIHMIKNANDFTPKSS